eukprot:NODE_6762_length_819_cov_110.887931_g6526_i0.p1 GENE.NODE_6762_length_819_cov_110.887931_g6526_i0~~NODE_6762_length_819_cov_110.887931_g6526_i0.p1  ORF type:complete len:148 (+),score=15.85 NODE_6762_length_819_cov_110.887931_g6526_i0:108-551(+)
MLVVDDTITNRQLLTRILESLSHPVEQASDGQEAVNKTNGSEYTIIWMDVVMPVMDGIEATETIRAKRRENCLRCQKKLGGQPGCCQQMPIISVTGNAMEMDIQRCMTAGVDEVLTKPYRRAEVEKLCAKWLGRHSSQCCCSTQGVT